MSPVRHALLIGIREYPYLDDADLGGPKNDLILMGTLLRDRFGFPPDRIRLLLDEEATQAEIRAAMDAMVETVEKDDIAVFYYSGHGSRMADPVREGEMLESIVPHDSGRSRAPNRDIADIELGHFIRRLNKKTSNVILIFDCCHSGTMTRDPFGTAVRAVESDHRRPEEMFENGLIPALLRAPETRSSAPSDRSGLSDVRGQHQAVVLAACREDEEAQEYMHRADGRNLLYGAWTFFLGGELVRAAPGAHWLDVVEPAAREVNALFRLQHPQVEGNSEQVLFGSGEARKDFCPTLKTVDGHQIEISGGLAEPGLKLRLDLPPKIVPSGGFKGGRDIAYEAAAELRELIEATPFLVEEEPADVLVRYLPPRTEVGAGDPCPFLGPLEAPAWAAVGPDGRLAVTARGADQTERLVGELVGRTRYNRLLAIANADASSRLHDRIRLVVTRRQSDGTFVAAEPGTDGFLSFEEGDVVDFEVHNAFDEPVWITLLHFGCDGSIHRMIPLYRHPSYQPTGYRLAAGEVLRASKYYAEDLRYRRWEGFQVQLPTSAEALGADAESGLVYLKLMVTLEPADFGSLEQDLTLGPPEVRDPGPQSHPLLHLVRLYGAGRGERHVAVRSAAASPSRDWTVVTRSVVEHRVR